MKRIRWLVVIAVLGAGLAWAGVRGYQQYQKLAREKTQKVVAVEALHVRASPVSEGDVRDSATLTGKVRPLAQVQVVSKVMGRLERLRLEDGSLVDVGVVIAKAGVAIAEVDHAELKAAEDQAKAAVAVAKAAVGEAEANLANAQRERNRIVKLFDQGSGTEQARDQVESGLERAKAGKLVATAGVSQAEAALARAQVMLGEAFIKAPIAGVVSHKWLDEGNFVAPGTPIVCITDLETVKIVVGVSEGDAAVLAAGKTKARILVDSDGKTEFEGTVSRIGVVADEATHTVEVEILVPNREHRLRPNAFARVRVDLTVRKNVPLIPENAVVRRGGETYAFVVQDGKAHRRVVTLGLPSGKLVEVKAGVAVGELLVTSGQELLNEGSGVVVDAAATVKESGS